MMDHDQDERYQRMVERIRARQTRDGMSGNETRPPLSTRQFYSSNTIFQNRSTLPLTSQTFMAPHSVAPSTSTSHAPTERSEFKVPGLPVRQNHGVSSAWSKCSTRFRSSIHKLMNTHNKRTLKLAIRVTEEILDIDENSHPPIDNPALMWDMVYQTVKEKYYNNSNVPSSMMSSMSSSNFGERATADYARGPGSLLSMTSASEDPVLAMMRPRVAPTQPDAYDQLMAEVRFQASRSRPEGGMSSMSHFDDSVQAQRRDERSLVPKFKPPPPAVDTPRTRAKVNRKPAPAARSAAYSKPLETPTNNGRPEQEGGTHTVTRSGRVVKTPVLFWQQQGNTSCMNNSSMPMGKQNLSNEIKSQVAKRTVVAVKANLIKKAAKGGGTPLSTIGENTVTCPKPRQKQDHRLEAPVRINDKENVSIGKSATSKATAAPLKKSNVKNISKDTSKVFAMDETKQNRSKVGRKRKSGDAVVRDSHKKKKVESPKLPEARTGADEIDDSDDDLFSAICRPKGIVSSQVVSPNAAGILSAKKALAVSVSKETPPCKSVGQMLDIGTISGARSSSAPAPKPKMSQVAKRVAKNIAKTMKDKKLKPAPKGEAPKTKTIPIGTYKEGDTIYTMEFGEEYEEEDSADDEDDDDLA